MTIDSTLFRQAAGCFATGVSVITTGTEGNYRAVTVNSFTTVSLDPTLLLFCLDNRSRTLPLLIETGLVTVNVLREDQEEVSRMFASSQSEHSIDELDYELGTLSTPTIKGTLANFQCRVMNTYEAGDHTIVIAAVEQVELGEEGRPLLFFRGKYGLPA